MHHFNYDVLHFLGYHNVRFCKTSHTNCAISLANVKQNIFTWNNKLIAYLFPNVLFFQTTKRYIYMDSYFNESCSFRNNISKFFQKKKFAFLSHVYGWKRRAKINNKFQVRKQFTKSKGCCYDNHHYFRLH